jgi:hypothetical protein
MILCDISQIINIKASVVVVVVVDGGGGNVVVRAGIA